MKIRRLQIFLFILSMICVIFIILYTSLLLLTVFSYLLGAEYPHFEFSLKGITLYTNINQNETLDQVKTASIFVLPILILTYIYALSFGYIFFKAISNGESPFQEKFLDQLKKIGITEMVVGISTPLLYSLILTIIKYPGYFFIIQLDPLFIIGLSTFILSKFLSYKTL